MFVDIFEKQRKRKPQYRKDTFYGELQHIFCVKLDGLTATSRKLLGLQHSESTSDVVLLAAIRTCVLEPDDPQLCGLDIHFYSKQGALHVVDITSVQCLVGRVEDGESWAIIDRSGPLARAIGYNDDGDDDIYD